LDIEDTNTIRREVRNQEGRFYENLDDLRAAQRGHVGRVFLVVPFYGDSNDQWERIVPPDSGVAVVSEYWFERCLEYNKVLDLKFDSIEWLSEFEAFLLGFTHVIGVSGYDGAERGHLSRLSTLLGASFTEHFSRKNTVLMCRPGTEQKSAKWKKAVEWRIPCVGSEWLEACAREVRFLSVIKLYRQALMVRVIQERAIDPREFSAQGGAGSVTGGAQVVPKMADQKVGAKIERPTAVLRAASNVNVGESARFTPHFDLEDTLKNLETPQPTNPRLDSIPYVESPLDVSFAKHLGKAIEIVGRKVANGMDDTMEEAPLSISQVGQRELPPSNLLEGVTICVSARLSHRRRELNQLATNMGANILMVYSSDCTHYIHQGNKQVETFKEFKQAKAKGKWIVSPVWLQKCNELRQRVNEADYPHTYDPNRSLEITGMASQMDPARLSQRPSKGGKESRGASPMGKRNGDVTPPGKDGNQKKEDGGEGEGTGKKTSPAAEQFAAKVEGLSEKIKEEKFRRRPRGSITSSSVTTPILKNSLSRLSTSSAYDPDTTMEGGDETVNQGYSIGGAQTHPNYSLTQSSQPVQNGNQSGGKRRRGSFAEGGDGDGDEDGGESSIVTYDDFEGRRERDKLLADFAKRRKAQRTESNLSAGGVVGAGDVTPVADEEEKETGEEGRNGEGEKNVTANLFGRRESEMEVKIEGRRFERKDSVLTNGTADTTPVVGGGNGNDGKRGRALSPIPVDPPPAGRRSARSSAAPSVAITPTIPIKKILFTGIPAPDRPRYGAIVRKLGGKLIDSDEWSAECTHLIAGKMARTEKCLAGVARGVWLLKSAYLDESAKAGRWLNEEVWEWGADDDQWAAVRRWRLELGNYENHGQRNGAFKGWKVLLVLDAKKRDGFARLLKAGGAEVVMGSSPYRGVDKQTFTLCATDRTAEQIRLSAALMALHEKGTVFVNSSYCADYIVKDPIPERTEYCLLD
ncbi:DNA topoisomerase 2-binding protein 1, partial [Rhizophlyctis rosea]